MENEAKLKMKAAIKVALMVRPQILETHVDRLDLITDAVFRVFEDEVGRIQYFEISRYISEAELYSIGEKKEDFMHHLKFSMAKDIMHNLVKKDMFNVVEIKGIGRTHISIGLNVIR